MINFQKRPKKVVYKANLVEKGEGGYLTPTNKVNDDPRGIYGRLKPIGEKLYNIHRRSLPVGVDKIVIMGVTYKEGQALLEHHLKPKVIHKLSKNQVKVLKTIYYQLI